MENKISELKKEIQKIENNNFRLMWSYANWEWKGIIILGIISLLYLLFNVGSYIGSKLN